MNTRLLPLAGLLVAGLATSPAHAQSPAGHFKNSPRQTSPVAAPPPNVVLDGRTTSQLQQAAGPRAGAALLPALPGGPAGMRVQRAEESGLPIFLSVPAAPGHDKASGDTPLLAGQASLEFLSTLKNELQVQQPSQEFAVLSTTTDQLGQTHVRLRQQWQGLPMYGAEVLVHLDASGQPTLFSGRYFRTPAALTSVVPTVTAANAAAMAEATLRPKTAFVALSAETQRLLKYTGPETELVVFHPAADAAPVLAWHVTTRPSVVARWETMVDARTGKVLQQLETSCSTNGPRTGSAPDLNGVTRTFGTYEYNSQAYMLDATQPMFNLGKSTLPDQPVGALLTLDARNTSGSTIYHNTSATNTWTATTQRSAVSAHYNAGVAYNYYRTVHNRNSIDGAGGTIISVVRMTEANGAGMDNAYWNGSFMAYGEGNVAFLPLAGGLDVAGHEMTHGVISHSANLEYQGQSGALNEHMADVFGCSMDPANWTIGEAVTRTSYIASGALRSLADPHNGGSNINTNGYQPRTMAEFYTTTSDNGGVHINSGIPNWAFYKFATAIGRAHAEQTWYRALTVYLTRSAQFIDLRLAVIQAAKDLYGTNSVDVAAAQTAFDAVGILGSTPPTTTTTTLPANPGQDYVLSYNTDPGATGTWYRSSTAGTNFVGLSTTEARCKPSVDDQGQVAVYVDSQGRIRRLQLSSPYTETVVQNQPVWKSVAISKDGTKLAAVTMAADTSIYLFNLTSGQVARAHLYNPTTSAGVSSSGVRYADALEWDYSGQRVIYDAYNVIPNATGGGIDYWDIGVLNAWNSAANTWGDGTIQKLVPSLPAGISIGNPSLAKLSPKVMAFDYYDDNGGAAPFKVLAVNIETGASGTIMAQNTVAGTPCYSKLDDKLIFNAQSSSGHAVVAVTNLQASKIAAAGSPTGLIDFAQWGVWYAQGQRVLGTKPTANPLPDFAAYPNPAHDELTIEMSTSAPVTLTLYDLMGRIVRTAPASPAARTTFALRDLAPGSYVLRATDGQRTSTRLIVKE